MPAKCQEFQQRKMDLEQNDYMYDPEEEILKNLKNLFLTAEEEMSSSVSKCKSESVKTIPDIDIKDNRGEKICIISKFLISVVEFEDFVTNQNTIKHEYIEIVHAEIKEQITNNQNFEKSVEDELEIKFEDHSTDLKSKLGYYNENSCPISLSVSNNSNSNDDTEFKDKDVKLLKNRSLNMENTDRFLTPIPGIKVRKSIINDASSNYNYYQKDFIPKIVKNTDNIKNKIAFLKSFKPKFIKRENIDKKITRNFRRFLIITNKKRFDTLEDRYNTFWARFIKENLLPPMKFVDKDKIEKVDFRSFNTNYMVWLFSKAQAKELYEQFINSRGNAIMSIFKEIAEESTGNKENNTNELEQIQNYIYDLHNIYYMPDDLYNSALQDDSKTIYSNFLENKDLSVISEVKKNKDNESFNYSNKPYEEYLGLGLDCNFEVRENMFANFKYYLIYINF